MKKRRQKKRIHFLLLVTFSFLILFMSSAYAILSQDVVVQGRATIMKQESTGGDFVTGEVGEEGGLVENEDGSHDFVGDETSAVSNYIQLPGDTYLWRILSIDSDGNLKIIRNRDESLTSIYTTADSSNWAGTTVLANLNSFYQEHLANLSDIIVQNPN